MCVIAFSPKNKQIPCIDDLYSCYCTNPDGCGYMIYDHKNDKIHIKKFFGDDAFDMFVGSLEADKNYFDFTEQDAIFHFRIATSGIPEKSTQPFYVNNNRKSGFCHNGVFHEFTYSSSDYSDTFFFNKCLLRPFTDCEGRISKERVVFLKSYFHDYGQKGVILNKDGAILLGEFTEHDDAYYSNLHHVRSNWYRKAYQKKYTDENGEYILIDGEKYYYDSYYNDYIRYI